MRRRVDDAEGTGFIDPDPGELVAATGRTIAAYLHEHGGWPGRSIVVFDGSKGTATRRALFPGYKAGRTGVRREIITDALGMVMGALKRDGFGVVRLTDWEADDVMATLAARIASPTSFVRILTSDYDLLQCVTAYVGVVKPRTTLGIYQQWWECDMRNAYGFPAPLLADYKALMGDSSDEIPGVPGIGQGYARRLVGYGGIDTLYARPSPLPPLLAAKIAGHESLVRRNLALVKLDRNVPLEQSTKEA